MRILFIGDIVGRPGRKIIEIKLREIVHEHAIDFVIANAENAAGGSGLTRDAYASLMKSGVHAITMGDHVYRKSDIVNILESCNNIVRPANFPASAPGKSVAVVETLLGTQVAILTVLGRTFMRPVDCPFGAVDRVLDSLDPTIRMIVVDMHAEATSDKQLMARHLDGRVTAVLGTHTHVPTADEQILSGGTAMICDVGMTGPHESIIGRRVDRVMHTTLHFVPTAFLVASDDVRLNGALVDCDPTTGRAHAIRRLRVDLDPLDHAEH